MPQEAPRTARRINGLTVFRMRKLQNLTQAQVATRAGADDNGLPFINHTTVAHVEKGRQPTVATMTHIAHGLGVHLDEITYLAAVYTVEETNAEASA